MMRRIYLLNDSISDSDELVRILAEGFPESDGWNVIDYGKTRNRVLGFDYGLRRYVVKYFARTSWLDKLRVLSGGVSKARKAFENAIEILRAGMPTAEPVAAWETYRHGLLHDCGLITSYVDGPNVAGMYLDSTPKSEREGLARSLSDFTYALHIAGLVPKDYNVGNLIIASKEGEKYGFSLVDVNRFGFGKVPGMREAMKGFDQLGVNDALFDCLVRPYCEKRGWDPEKCRRVMEKSRRRSCLLRHFKNLFKATR